jgi:hypothetical protein
MEGKAMTAVDLSSAFITNYTEGVPAFPFVEDECGNITGYGHQDKAVFADEVNRYDQVSDPATFDHEDCWTADNFSHLYVLVGDDGESLIETGCYAEGAIPVTTLWGSR